MSLLDYFPEYMNKTATFTRFDGSLDSEGAPNLSASNYDDLFTGISCFFNPMSTERKIVRGKKATDKIYSLICQVLAIRENDHVEIDSVEYVIIGFKNTGEIGDHMTVECEAIK